MGYIIDLAEITIPNGVIRVDRCRLAFEHELTLGHFGLPHVLGKPARVDRTGAGIGTILTSSIPGRSVAMITYAGWDRLDHLVHTGRNAESEESTVLFAYRKRTAQNPSMELMVAAMLHKTDDSAWTQEELSPVRDIKLFDVMPSGSVVGAEILLADGTRHTVDFGEIDGFKSC